MTRILTPTTALGAKLRAESGLPTATRVLDPADPALGPGGEFLRYSYDGGEDENLAYGRNVLTIEAYHASLESRAEALAGAAREIILAWGTRHGDRALAAGGRSAWIKRVTASYPVALPTTDGRKRYTFTVQLWLRN